MKPHKRGNMRTTKSTYYLHLFIVSPKQGWSHHSVTPGTRPGLIDTFFVFGQTQ